MDCARVDEELIAFHLAALDGAMRAAVEAHLTGCARCVSSYLMLKRAMDAAEEAPAPSEIARARIRAEAEKQLAALRGEPAVQTQAAASLSTATERPEAQPQKRTRRARLVLVAAAAAAMIAAPLVYFATQQQTAATVSTPSVAPPPTMPVSTGNETIDTARTTPENLAFL